VLKQQRVAALPRIEYRHAEHALGNDQEQRHGKHRRRQQHH
jgi:hypothetical protein